MGQPCYLLAIDQGTTSSRAIVFDSAGSIQSVAQLEFTQHFPQDGWVEHNPEDIWDSTLAVVSQTLVNAGLKAQEITAIGITNQRETTIVWDAVTGKPIANAIVWQDRRTTDFCQSLTDQGLGSKITEKTGLLIDPYFSASKIKWLLDNVDGARALANEGRLRFGTVDSFLLWRLTDGQKHFTDATNASRTMLYDIHKGCWDPELLALFDVPASMLPEVLDSSADFGVSSEKLLGAAIPIRGMAGDQQAALFGQACFQKGMVKSTYGTGCFMMINSGCTALRSNNRMLTTIAYQLQGKPTYAIEGSIFVAGAAVQWLRDGIKLIQHASETEKYAEITEDTGGVYMVPAFTGLGAPYWDPKARGAILGLTRDTGIAEIVTACLQSICYQTKDLMRAMENDGAKLSSLRVDGGMVGNNWLVQFLSDNLALPVERPQVTETTALGVAYLAGLGCGVYKSLEEISEQWRCDKRFVPKMDKSRREALYLGWRDAVERVRTE